MIKKQQSGYSKLKGNAPYYVLKWLQCNGQYKIIEKAMVDEQFLALAFNEPLRKKLIADIEKANEICTIYRTSLLRVLDVACERLPVITISCKGAESYVVTLIIRRTVEFKTEVPSADKAIERARVLNQSYSCALFADVTHIGNWFSDLPLEKRLNVIYKTIIGDFGHNFYSPTLDLVEKKRIEHNQLVGSKSYDYFIDKFTGSRVYNPYRLTSEPAARYGWDYLLWYNNVKQDLIAD